MPAFEFNMNELHRLRQLSYAARIPALLGIEGSRRVRRSGEGVEFLDFRSYVAGDDPRHIDWNLYARLRQLFVRVFESQKYVSVGLLVDTSHSMYFGRPVQKVSLACQIASALGFVAVSHGEYLTVATFAQEIARPLGPLHHAHDLPRLIEYLQASEMGSATDLYAAIRSFCMQLRTRGLLILVSDFLSAGGYEQALRLALSLGRRLLIVQVLDELDLGYGLTGNLDIRDSETGQGRIVCVDDEALGRYRQSMRDYCQGLAAFCRMYGQHHVQVSTQESFLEIVCQTIRSTAVLR